MHNALTGAAFFENGNERFFGGSVQAANMSQAATLVDIGTLESVLKYYKMLL